MKPFPTPSFTQITRIGLALGLGLVSWAHAADITIQPASGDALVVRNSAGSSEHLRIEESGSRIALGASTNKLLIDADGNVLVGASYPPVSYRFQVDGITGSFYDNGLRLNNTTASSGWNLYSSSSGALIIGRTGNLGQFDGVTGAYTSLSDERAKTAIRPLDGVLDKVMQLPLSRYQYKSGGPQARDAIGLTAQDLQQQFPELVTVHTANDGNPGASNQMFVNYSGLGVIALRALQEQQALINGLTSALESAQKRVATLVAAQETTLSSLRAELQALKSSLPATDSTTVAAHQ